MRAPQDVFMRLVSPKGLAVALMAVSWTLGAPALSAADLDGIAEFPDYVESAAGPLILSGCGVREVLWHDVYSIGLYLPEPLEDAGRIREPSLAKQVRIEILYGGDVPDGLPSEWYDHLDDLLKRDVFATFEGLYQDLKTGDTLILGYTPAQGTSVRHNGGWEIKSAGHRVMDAFLELWLGPKPVSRNLRRLLLSGEC